MPALFKAKGTAGELVNQAENSRARAAVGCSIEGCALQPVGEAGLGTAMFVVTALVWLGWTRWARPRGPRKEWEPKSHPGTSDPCWPNPGISNEDVLANLKAPSTGSALATESQGPDFQVRNERRALNYTLPRGFLCLWL